MNPWHLIAPPVVFALCVVGTLTLRSFLISRQVLDTPNERSSHSTPVARGGGLVFVAAVALWMLPALLGYSQVLPGQRGALIALVLVAFIGWLDDRRGVPPAVRLVVHLLASAVVVIATLRDSGVLVVLDHPAAAVGLILLCAWMINLTNFMDGIDGLAGAEGVFVLGGAAALCTGSAAAPAAAMVAVFAAAVAGFLAVNISRAKIFMGDAGSGSLGLLMAWVLLALTSQGWLAACSASVLPAVFVADASVTLLVRLVRRQHPAQAHRTHAYQRLVRRGMPHLGATALYALVNIGVVLPAAWAGSRGLLDPMLVAGGVYCLLLPMALALGAGREPASGYATQR